MNPLIIKTPLIEQFTDFIDNSNSFQSEDNDSTVDDVDNVDSCLLITNIIMTDNVDHDKRNIVIKTQIEIQIKQFSKFCTTSC